MATLELDAGGELGDWDWELLDVQSTCDAADVTSRQSTPPPYEGERDACEGAPSGNGGLPSDNGGLEQLALCINPEPHCCDASSAPVQPLEASTAPTYGDILAELRLPPSPGQQASRAAGTFCMWADDRDRDIPSDVDQEPRKHASKTMLPNTTVLGLAVLSHALPRLLVASRGTGSAADLSSTPIATSKGLQATAVLDDAAAPRTSSSSGAAATAVRRTRSRRSHAPIVPRQQWAGVCSTSMPSAAALPAAAEALQLCSSAPAAISSASSRDPAEPHPSAACAENAAAEAHFTFAPSAAEGPSAAMPLPPSNKPPSQPLPASSSKLPPQPKYLGALKWAVPSACLVVAAAKVLAFGTRQPEKQQCRLAAVETEVAASEVTV